MAEVLRKNPKIYDNLKNTQTKKGVTLAACIKTGMDNKGHPMIKTVGMTAGDEDSFEVFKELFDPVIDIRHGGYKPDAKHPTDLDTSKLSSTVIDPTGKYVLSTRVRTGRSIRGLRLPPTCKKGERREVERVMTKALLGLEGELKGDYYPLAHSNSYPPKMGGMTMEEEDKMRDEHFLFQEPDSTLLLASGMGRHWPDARGIFANEAKNFLVWCNEEDHTRIISMEMGADIKNVFTRFVLAVNTCEEVVKKEGYDFMHNDHLGYILVCPSNLGTGLRASVMVKIPFLSARKDFKEICSGLRLQPRGGAGVDSASSGGVFDISNSDRLGTSEVALVNLMIEGCAKLVQMEQKLEKGEAI
jgi:creatine kinase